jgi:hypothetical protein
MTVTGKMQKFVMRDRVTVRLRLLPNEHLAHSKQETEP